MIITTDSKLTMKSAAAIFVRARTMRLLWALTAAILFRNKQHYFCLASHLPSSSAAYHSVCRTIPPPQSYIGCDAQTRIKRTHLGITSASFSDSSKHGRRRSSLRMQNNDENSNDKNDRGVVLQTAATTAGLVAQPIVWASLYCVATTGAGLPAGPGGLLGALEGVSYLVILAWVVRSSFFLRSSIRRETFVVSEGNAGTAAAASAAAAALSWVSLLAGLVVLARLVADQGCIPNAQPILDYSNYLPVCRSSE